MPLELQEINPEADFPGLARCMFDSYEDPPQKFFHVFFPIHGNGDEAREAAIDEAATRLKLWHTHDPSSYWTKVVETDTGKIAGAGLWNIHKENPFANPPAAEVTWFPNDSSRTYVEKVLQRHSAPRSRVAQKPHLYLFIIFTRPEYRRKGVGQQIMDWGFNKADELGYDFYLDATPYGRPLYESNGFTYIEENLNHPQTDEPDEKWKAIEEKQEAADLESLPGVVDDNVRAKNLGNHQESQTWRHNDTTVIKRVSPPEAAAMVTAQSHFPSVPVPRVLGFYMPRAGEDSRYGIILMEYIDGVSLEEFWPTASEEDKARILGQLRGHMDQLRTLESEFIGSCNGKACNDHMFVNREHTYGPYKDDTAFREGIAQSLLTCMDETDAFTKMVIDMLNSMPKTNRYVFTHGDFLPRNILVKDGNVVGIIDWEVAGFYPEYWEYAKAHIFDNYFHPWHKNRDVNKVLDPYPLQLAVLLHTKEIFMC